MSETKTQNRLASLRSELRQIDANIFALTEKRMRLSRQIGELKKNAGLGIEDTTQEQRNLDQNQNLASDELPAAMIDELTRLLVNWSKKAQK